MDSIATARDFFINQQGLSPDQADMLVSQGLQAFNQQTQPQSMMQMANGGRIGFSGGSGKIDLGGLNEYELFKLKELGYDVKKKGVDDFGGTKVLKDILKVNKYSDFSSGGIARLGYQMGGETEMNEMDMNQADMTQMNMEQPDMGQINMDQMAMPQMNQQQALETIIQILIENGIPPEQAQQLALQILQMFIQGGEPAVEAFANQLEQEEEMQEPMMMAGGGIAGLYPRQNYKIGRAVRGITKAVSGVVKGVGSAVKSVAKSPIGKIALTAAAIYAAGGGALFGGQGFGSAGTLFGPGGALGGTTGIFGAAPIAGTFGPPSAGIFGVGGQFAPFSGTLATGVKNLFSSPLNLISSAANVATGGDKKGFGIGTLLGVGGAGAALGSLLGAKKPEESDEQYQQRLQSAGPYLREYYTNLNPGATQQQIDDFVRLNTVEYGGLGQGNTFAIGGMVPPARRIAGGIIELDARKTGGYIPYGKKERVDDVPAMLAKDEFVFTSRAVKGAGQGSARRGAAKMYALMKKLEAKGRKMERGARA